mmetsp:Transcript_2480/g.4734  ORF Transcript_2480/g.4734 Transcript_2480/m.4734 type:complete len:384 (-) Transcript_2480:939-2090(-)
MNNYSVATGNPFASLGFDTAKARKKRNKKKKKKAQKQSEGEGKPAPEERDPSTENTPNDNKAHKPKLTTSLGKNLQPAKAIDSIDPSQTADFELQRHARRKILRTQKNTKDPTPPRRAEVESKDPSLLIVKQIKGLGDYSEAQIMAAYNAVNDSNAPVTIESVLEQIQRSERETLLKQLAAAQNSPSPNAARAASAAANDEKVYDEGPAAGQDPEEEKLDDEGYDDDEDDEEGGVDDDKVNETLAKSNAAAAAAAADADDAPGTTAAAAIFPSPAAEAAAAAVTPPSSPSAIVAGVAAATAAASCRAAKGSAEAGRLLLASPSDFSSAASEALPGPFSSNRAPGDGGIEGGDGCPSGEAGRAAAAAARAAAAAAASERFRRRA